MPDRAEIMMLAVHTALLVIPSSCTRTEPVTAERELAAIATKCNVPASWVWLEHGTELHLRPEPTARYEQIDCLLMELQRSDRLRGMISTGFVGNSAPESGNAN